MKTNTSHLAALAVFALLPTISPAAVSVDFSGGAGAPLSFTLPAITWQITNASDFNANAIFGIGIAVGQSPEYGGVGGSIGGNPADWSASGSITIPTASVNSFYSNNDFAGPNSGGIIWFGIRSNRMAVNSDTLTFSGGTLGSDSNVLQSFADGSYEIYLISGNSGQAASSAGIAAVPEASTPMLGVLALALTARRKRR